MQGHLNTDLLSLVLGGLCRQGNIPSLTHTSESRKHSFYPGLSSNLLKARESGGMPAALFRGPLMRFDLQRVGGSCLHTHGQAAVARAGCRELEWLRSHPGAPPGLVGNEGNGASPPSVGIHRQRSKLPCREKHRASAGASYFPSGQEIKPELGCAADCCTGRGGQGWGMDLHCCGGRAVQSSQGFSGNQSWVWCRKRL